MAQGPVSLAVIAGLRRETALLRAHASSDVLAFAAGGSALRAGGMIDAWVARHRIERIVSFGIAGGLAPGLRPGSLVVPAAVIAPDGRALAADRALSEGLAAKLDGTLRGDLAGLDAPAATAAEKAALHARHGAIACDMESHGVAAAAARHGIPFACIRAIADPAERALPAAALAGFGPDGGLRVLAVLGAALRRPGAIGALAALARDTQKAMAALRAALLAGALRE